MRSTLLGELDDNHRRRIIKDVMKHQLTGRGGAEKGREKKLCRLDVSADETGVDLPDVDDEIDPADFIDPEEFSVKRRPELWSHA